ncbi:hypothetical protein ACHWQZ_G006184 [Mnemiopsis leidyi]
MDSTDEDKVCNNCKRDIPAANLDLHLSHCVKNLRLCTLCDDPIPIREFEDHIKEEHAEIECSKCKSKFQQGDEDLHESVCPEARIDCEFCDVDFPRNALPSHSNACGSRTEECENCAERVMLKELTTHICRPRNRSQDRSNRLATTTDMPRTSTSPYSLYPTPAVRFTGADYLNEVIATEHFDQMNGSAVDLDAALAAQLAHDEQRQAISLNDQFTDLIPSTIMRNPRPRSNDSDTMMLPCEFCEAMYPMEELILHQTGCLDNSITISNPAIAPLDQVNGDHDSFIPCEFCCKHFPLSLISQHQAGCTPTRRGPSYPEIVDERPIRPIVSSRTVNTGPRSTTVDSRPQQTTSRFTKAAPRSTDNTTSRFGSVSSQQAGRSQLNPSSNKRRDNNSRTVSQEPSSCEGGSENNIKIFPTSRASNEARGIKKELVPKPKMTLHSAGKEPARVKNTRTLKTNNMNDLGKAPTSRFVPPAVVIPKRRVSSNVPRSGTNNSSSDNNSSETLPALSPKIMNRNPRNSNSGPNPMRNGRKKLNGSSETSNGSGAMNNFPGTSKKNTTSKDCQINVSSSENRRVRDNILSKYQRPKDKSLVVSGSNPKSEEKR